MDLSQAWHLGSLFKVPVKVHFTFFIPLCLIIGLSIFKTGLIWGTVAGIMFMAMLSFIILAHEFGHILMARRYGYKTYSVYLHAMGGLALMEFPHDGIPPKHDMKISFAGPAVNFALALICLPILFLVGPAIGFFSIFALMNLGIGIFNLTPAWPLDGSRILRSWLTLKYGKIKARDWTIKISKVFAILFIVVGLITFHPGLFVGGIIIWKMSSNKGHEFI